MNNWKKIWDKKEAEETIFLNGNRKSVFLELKRCNGFDVVDGMSYEAFYKQYVEIRDNLQKQEKIESVYEVGCGSGANLYLFEEEGYSTGGLDYSQSLTDIAQRVLDTEDIMCTEAIALGTDKMYMKFRKVIGLIDVHDIEKYV